MPTPDLVYLIGLGGVGKTTCGRLFAQRLHATFLDLDEVFQQRWGPIADLINREGYERYYKKNSALFYELQPRIVRPAVVALSSGFLVYPDQQVVARHLDTVRQGVSILLLPSANVDEATEIVVRRQLARGLGLVEATERAKFRERFAAYRGLGDRSVFSKDEPAVVADVMVMRYTAYLERVGGAAKLYGAAG